MRHLLLIGLAACQPSGSTSVEGTDTDPLTVTTGTTSAPHPETLMTTAGLMRHLDALQAIADAHDGHRSGASPGYMASVDYAESVFTEAGYAVERVPFTYPGWEVTGPSVLDAEGEQYGNDVDIAAMYYSPAGDVTADLHAVDLVLPPTQDSSSTSGCETDDFDGFPAGAIALIQRGTCTFNAKAVNAEAAGASGVVIFNEGQTGRQDLEPWQLDSENQLSIPVLGATFATGESLAAALEDGAVNAHLVVDVFSGVITSENLIAEVEGRNPDAVIVVGGHLDSVPSGPGINDNGSGTAFILEMAAAVAQRELPPRNTIRFALWGSEELGLLGSTAYVDDLPESELDRIVAKLNFDMMASPNGLPMIYDGDGDGFGIPGPAGSADIEEVFTAWFDREGLDAEATAFDGRSDYAAFIGEGIPAGGLFSGADASKTSAEASRYGGTAGLPHDPCYHQSCDDIGNLDEDLFLTLSRAAAYTTWELAERTDWQRRSAANAVKPIALTGARTSCSGDSVHHSE